MRRYASTGDRKLVRIDPLDVPDRPVPASVSRRREPILRNIEADDLGRRQAETLRVTGGSWKEFIASILTGIATPEEWGEIAFYVGALVVFLASLWFIGVVFWTLAHYPPS